MAESSSSLQNINSVIEQVIIKNKYGEKLVGVLYETSSKEVIILCHGLASKKECSVNLILTDALTKEGISVFSFDFSGNGESEGTFEFGNYSKEADDLHSVVMYFSGLKQVIGGILGHGKGGNSALVYASKYHDVATVVSLSARYYMDKGIEELLGKDYMSRIKEKGYLDFIGDEGTQYRVTEESLMERLGTDMHSLCLSIAPDCRVFSVYGDASALMKDLFEFIEAIPNNKTCIVGGADHNFNNHQSGLVMMVMSIIKELLQKTQHHP